MAQTQALFSQARLGDARRSQEQKLVQAAKAIPAAKALAHTTDELTDELLAQFQVEPLVSGQESASSSFRTRPWVISRRMKAACSSNTAM